MKMNPKSIWNERQNRPSLVVKDLAKWVSADVVYESLLRRGVFKWLAVRRDIIKVKNKWKDEINLSFLKQRETDTRKDYWRGYRKAKEECRAEIRAFCHSQRWRAPDIDPKATTWLEKYGSSN